MNCPSRTDDTLLHCEWNQNPPSLAPDLTTRQDLNGISNARVLKTNDGLVGLPWSSLEVTGMTPTQPFDPEKRRPPAPGASLTPSGPPYPPTGSHAGLQGTNARPACRPWLQKLWSWATWLLSVLCTSALISHQSLAQYLGMNRSPVLVEDVQPTKNATQLQPGRLLAARDTCAQGGVDGAAYDLPLHVAALFIILAVSGLACAFPILAVRFPRLRIPGPFLFFVSHFGTGVLIATAFVHLLPTAFTSLNHPCLSSFWTQDYPAMPGAIALAGIFLVTVIEMVFSPARHVCRGGARFGDLPPPPTDKDNEKAPIPRINISDHSHCTDHSDVPSLVEPLPHLRDLGPLIGRSSSISRSINRMGDDPDRICRIASAPEGPVTHLDFRPERLPDVERITDELSRDQKYRKEMMQVFMLEMGILFHSVFIGMSLSVSIGNEFVILLIAIVFHQTFEGLALGARIAALDWPEDALQPWLMSLAYGCTTPIGQAIGLATHTLYSPDSEVGLLVVGVMNAISAGLLIFASLVELMSEDFLSDESWRVLRGKRRVFACILVFLGAFCMSIVGAWA
ncbi:Zip-domain-containing protein [Aspergillus campestris IBT 28561]|uniref:Zip-domain-containing protein n=1 Tax=Aspergillus campestris (strain IBT 28561) TaxID=1392248 RepID=A0A2I1D3P9_ASPC2|nr:Zip-domain-containing protein [Aspergillus campestris IBT 28561]PKY04496.1 Zip-domain-containing protein [Aspergillus campestris IBT 28561]